MSTTTQTVTFGEQVDLALNNVPLQQAMGRAESGFVETRRQCVEAMPEFESLRDTARDIKEHTLEHLDSYLEFFEAKVIENGGTVHWASSGEEACRIILEICQQAEARLVTKGKSMVAEEIHLNEALEKGGLEVVETDLGEYIIQLANEMPSHIIAPAMHKTRSQISELFHTHHQSLGYVDKAATREEIVSQARQVLRDVFVSADVGITGANFLVAETGSNVIVTNEGNGDLTSCLPRVQIITAGIEKVIPSLEDLSVFLRLLARSATGQEMSAYTTLYTGPRRDDDPEGPEEYHVVLVDNGRSAMLAGNYRSMLRCIRCGACLNHCPVYTAIGGHSYGWIYTGPMGAVLTPLMTGLDNAYDLPNACTLNGRCQEVCPVRIPLPDFLRQHRVRQNQRRLGSGLNRQIVSMWAWSARRPRFYHAVMALPVRLLSYLGRHRGAFEKLPFGRGWTVVRDFPAPTGSTFQQQWQKRKREKP